MFFSKDKGLLALKEQAKNHYEPNTISKIAMEIFNSYSLEFSPIQQEKLLGLIAMDMGEEFYLTQTECLDIIESLIKQS